MYKDFTIQDGGRIYYRETSNPSDLKLYSQRIKENTATHVVVKHAIVVTYVNVQEVAVESSRYTFQVVLCDTGAPGFFGIINYYRLTTSGDSTSGYQDQTCEKKVFGKLRMPTVAEVERTKYGQVFQVAPCDIKEGKLVRTFRMVYY